MENDMSLALTVLVLICKSVSKNLYSLRNTEGNCEKSFFVLELTFLAGS